MDDLRHEPGFTSIRRVPARPRATQRPIGAIVLAAIVAIGAAGALFWVFRPDRLWDTPLRVGEAPAAQPAAAPQPAASVAVLQPAPPGQALGPADVEPALVRLLGRESVLRYLSTTDFPRRFVATVDNLARPEAPSAAWPVHPAPGRFTAARQGDAETIAEDNAQRYAPFVAFATSIDVPEAVALYRRLDPLLQQAYRELGFGSRSFHQRVLQVIDVLLATPEPATPPRVTVVDVKGPAAASTRPWTRYEYVDPSLQRLAAGQKILLRVGPAHRAALKAKLRELRQELLKVSWIEAAQPGAAGRP